jgi:hypothetical protein
MTIATPLFAREKLISTLKFVLTHYFLVHIILVKSSLEMAHVALS